MKLRRLLMTKPRELVEVRIHVDDVPLHYREVIEQVAAAGARLLIYVARNLPEPARRRGESAP